MTDEPTIDAEPRVDDLRKENARLARRVGRLEATLREVEQIRDTNARLLDRIRGELDTERRRRTTCCSTSCPSRSSIGSTPASG